MDKWGYIMRQMKKDIREYNVVAAYAYNSDFDDKVFTYNCDWFKCNNPLENIPVYDIWGYASQFITKNEDYKAFCEEHKYFTDSGNYKGNAETVYRFISGDLDFEEAHMGLHDCEIEAKILHSCFIILKAKPQCEYKVIRILERPQPTPYTIKVNGLVIHEGAYIKKFNRNNVWSFREAE